MYTQLDNRWDLHVKISECPSTIFINMRATSFFPVFFKEMNRIFVCKRSADFFFFFC